MILNEMSFIIQFILVIFILVYKYYTTYFDYKNLLLKKILCFIILYYDY